MFIVKTVRTPPACARFLRFLPPPAIKILQICIAIGGKIGYNKEVVLAGAVAWEYYQRERPYLNSAMHTETKAELEKILIMLKQRGEKTTFSYLRKLLKKGNY